VEALNILHGFKTILPYQTVFDFLLKWRNTKEKKEKLRKLSRRETAASKLDS